MQREERLRFATWFPLMSPESRAELAAGALAHGRRRMAPASGCSPRRWSGPTRGSINRMLYVDTKLWLPDDLLARGDKMSMATSLEARVPCSTTTSSSSPRASRP